MDFRTCPSTYELAGAVDEILGRPFALGARGPGAFDCLGVMLWLYHRFGVDLPDPFEVDRLDQLAAIWGQFERVLDGDPQPLDVIVSDYSEGPDPLGLHKKDANQQKFAGQHVSVVESPRTEIVIAQGGTVARSPLAAAERVYRYTGWSE